MIGEPFYVDVEICSVCKEDCFNPHHGKDLRTGEKIKVCTKCADEMYEQKEKEDGLKRTQEGNPL